MRGLIPMVRQRLSMRMKNMSLNFKFFKYVAFFSMNLTIWIEKNVTLFYYSSNMLLRSINRNRSRDKWIG